MMMSVLVYGSWLVGVAVVAVLVLAFVKPATFRFERRTSVSAPPAAVFAHIEDLHRWSAWSPWEKIDPGMHREYAGAPKGVGATYAWRGNNKVGEGSMRVLESRAPEHVAIELEFLKPFAAKNRVVFTVTRAGDGSEVSWAMEGENKTLTSKVFAVLVNMDRLLGRDFERGLADLKRAAESGDTVSAAA